MKADDEKWRKENAAKDAATAEWAKEDGGKWRK